jgi:hypothetical protein
VEVEEAVQEIVQLIQLGQQVVVQVVLVVEVQVKV